MERVPVHCRVIPLAFQQVIFGAGIADKKSEMLNPERTCSQMGNAESYVMGRLGPAEVEGFEEHLLVCGICQDAVDFEDEFVGLFREVAQTFELQPALVASLEDDE